MVLCFCLKKKIKKSKLHKLVSKSSDRIDSELNIVKIIKNLKFLKILMKKHLTDPMMRKKIEHDDKNIVDLDKCSDTCSSSS